LQTILHLLDKKAWFDPLDELAKKFAQIPTEEYCFCTDLINMLHSLLDAQARDPNVPLAQLAAIRLAHLDCWTFRFESEAHTIKDPLACPVSEFTSQIHISQSTAAYPAPDIIKRWARDHLR
jgi:hypothetical protein